MLKRFVKREWLIPLFFIFSVLSVIIGLCLLAYFIYIFKGYFVKIGTGEYAIAKAAQEVDFWGLTYGTIWTFLGIFFYFIAIKLQIVELRFQIKLMADRKSEFREQIFETAFLDHARKHLEIVNSIKYEFETINQTNGTSSSFFVINGADFFHHVIQQMSYIFEAFMAGKYPKENLNDNEQKIFKTLIFFGISQRKFNTLLKVKNYNDEKGLLKFVYQEIFSFYNQFLEPYFRNFSEIYHLIDKTMEEEIQEQPEKKQEIKEKYLKYKKFFLTHISNPELALIVY
ncbi:MAG: hypothetical protein HY738_19865, partial [Bacteroidia bacterium]|nr:hypothetical protein [Bacteroidia bacterium]